MWVFIVESKFSRFKRDDQTQLWVISETILCEIYRIYYPVIHNLTRLNFTLIYELLELKA